MTKSHDDPTIDDLLDDPMTRAIMQADRVDPSELKAMLRALAPLVARAAGRSIDGDPDGESAPSDRNAVARLLRSMDRGGGATSSRTAARSGLQPQFCSAR
jgi:hypothetical protein